MSVSVLIACHNEEKYIEQALASVLAQSAREAIVEIIVVDDGSTDRTGEILDAMATRETLIAVHHIANSGPSEARNHAIVRARGELIALLDGDDYWVPDKLERQLPTLAVDPRVGLVYSDFVDFTADDASDAQVVNVRRYGPNNARTLAEYFVHDAPVMPSTSIIRKAVFDDIGLFDPRYRAGQDDTELCLRIASRWRFAHVPGGLAFKRRHGSNITRRLETLLPDAVAQTQLFVERFPALAPLAGKRMARRYARAGNDCIVNAERAKGLRYLVKAWRRDPLFARVYAYLLLAMLPGSGGRAQAKRLYHWCLWQSRRLVG